MSIMKFQEYLSRTGKLQTSGKVKKIADFEGKVDHKPAKESKHKDAGGKGQNGDIKPYKGGTDAKDPNKGAMGDGFAHKGDKKLNYQPETDVPAKVGEGGNKKATWPKTKMQEWIDKTKTMSLAEFTKNVREDTVRGLDECACQETPHNSIKETVNICKCNQQYISALVREMKRNGMFGKMLSEMIQHPEACKTLAKIMERDDSYARKLANALNEMIAPPMGGPMDGPPIKKKKPMPPMDDMGGEMGPEEDDMDMDQPSEDDMGDDEDDMGDEDLDSDIPDEDEGMDDMGDEGEDAEDAPMPPHDKIGKLPPKKHGGIDQLLSAMKNKHPAMGM